LSVAALSAELRRYPDGRVEHPDAPAAPDAFIVFVRNIAESISKGLSGAVFGVLPFLVIFLAPRGARQVVAGFGKQSRGKMTINRRGGDGNAT
jgi:hypothetical protein